MIPTLHSGQYVHHTVVDTDGTIYYIYVGDRMVGAYRDEFNGDVLLFTYNEDWTRHGVMKIPKDLFT